MSSGSGADREAPRGLSDEPDALRRQMEASRAQLRARTEARDPDADVGNRGGEATTDNREAIIQKAQDLNAGLSSDRGGGDEGGGAADKVKGKLPDTGT